MIVGADDASLVREYRSLFQQAAVGMHRSDRLGRYREVNNRLCTILGATREHILNATYFDFVHPADIDVFHQRITEIRNGSADDYTMVMRVVRFSDQAIRWIRVTGSRTTDDGDFFCIVEDIHEERTNVERQRLLLDELNHRVKNTLATVQSLAMNTIKSSPEEFYTNFESRLLALSRAHNLLTEGLWEGVSFDDLVGLIVRTFAPDSCTATGPTVHLKPNAAVTLSMVLHELGTNAVKYGSLSVPKGTVVIKWWISNDTQRVLHLLWREHGGPEVSSPSRRGFGSRLIEVAAAREFAGTSHVVYAKKGVECHLTIPMTNKVTTM